MNGEQKLLAICAICAAVAISVIAGSISYYCVSIDTAAIKAGLVQQRVGATNIWTEPQGGRRYRNEE